MIELPTLYAKDVQGRPLFWRVRAEGRYVVVEHGLLDAKPAVYKSPCSPTNVGRANERSAVEQAVFESQAAWTKKQKEGYFETIEDALTVEVFLPMLAHPVKRQVRRDRKIITQVREVPYPCDAQRKLNGLRCLSKIEMGEPPRLVSRGATEWTLPHIAQHLRILGRHGDCYDGEIYVHGVPLQKINSLVKDYRAPDSLILGYHIYDMPKSLGSTSIWEDRNNELSHRFQEYMAWCRKERVPPCLFPVETRRILTEAELIAFEQLSVDGGYEGLIIRRLDGTYAFNDRVDALLKWKRFTDKEFVVVAALSRELIDPATDKMTVILDKFVCQNDMSPDTFEVVPRGDMETRREWWEMRDMLVGERLKVRFFERSVAGIPQGNPVGLGFRLLEDTPIFDDDAAGMWE